MPGTSNTRRAAAATAGASAPATFVVLAAPSRNLGGLCLCSGDFLCPLLPPPATSAASASAPATFVVLAAPSRNLGGLCLCSGDFLCPLLPPPATSAASASAPATFVVLAAPSCNLGGLCLCHHHIRHQQELLRADSCCRHWQVTQRLQRLLGKPQAQESFELNFSYMLPSPFSAVLWPASSGSVAVLTINQLPSLGSRGCRVVSLPLATSRASSAAVAVLCR
jgi:hypothetical protein